jgi:predicted nucleotidyltransferase
MPRRNVEVDKLVAAMKQAGAALRDADIRFALAGGLACWARGGPATDHDVDLLVKPEDAEAALEACVTAGMRPERPPEAWLFKAYHDEIPVDLIFAPAGGPVTDELLDRAEEREVMAMRLPVSSLEDVLATKLLALTEQEPDYGAVLEIARTLREQIRWDEVREKTNGSPFAKAFFTLIEELGILPDHARQAA